MPSGDGRPQYNPDAFYLDSTDTKGHSAWARWRTPPWISGFLGEIVARPDTVYRTKDDFYRDSIVHRALWISDNIPVTKDVQEAISLLRVESALNTLLELQKSHEKMKSNLESFLRSASDVERRSLNSALDQLVIGLPQTYTAELRTIMGRWS